VGDIKAGNIQVTGLADLEKRLQVFPDKLARKIMSGAIRAGAVVIQKEAKLRAPRSEKPHLLVSKASKKMKAAGENYMGTWIMPGNLQRNIKVRPVPPKKRNPLRPIEYWVYDIASGDGDTIFSERSAFLGKILDGLSPHIRIVPTVRIDNRAQLDTEYAQCMDAGYEGQMVRLDAVYERKRSKTLLKRKEFVDSEFVILDVIEGDGNKSGMAASMLFRNPAGQEFNSNIKGDREYLRGLLRERGELLGKLATVKYFNLTPDGIPRFPYVIGIRDYE